MPTSKEPEPIKVSKLGIGGVNLCKTPLKLDDNEVAQAQNAEPYTDRGRAGIRKRPGGRVERAYTSCRQARRYCVNSSAALRA